MQDIEFHWFLPNHKAITKRKNITYFPISNELFTKSMINSKGVITGGGFETPSEALYLGKKLMCIPITDHYEQACNAAAAKELGAYVINKLDYAKFSQQILSWINTKNNNIKLKSNNIKESLEYIFSMH